MFMKHRYIALFLLSAISFFSCKNENTKPADAAVAVDQKSNTPSIDTSNYTTIQWLDSVQQFGNVTDGEKVLISFHFKNTGNKPLIISNVTAGCGCTVPEKPEAPIQPGEQGIIKAEFNSSGRVGQVSKNVTVTCNTIEQNYTLVFEGEVKEKKQTK
jgi:hypothetical protein